MKISDQQAETLIREGYAALQQGRATDARRALEEVAGAGSTNGFAWMLLAVARREDGDIAGEEEAINRLLILEPRSVRGHILKGDCRANAGDEEAAIHFYRSALRLAEGMNLPPEAMEDIRGAAESLAELQQRAHARREIRLRGRGLAPEQWSPRLRHALELAAGKRQLFLQQPTAFNYPELPHIQYYDPAGFDWAAEIEAAAPAIREELEAVLAQRGTDEFRAYIQAGSDELRMDENRQLLDNKDWSALFLCENGWMVPKAIDSCPRTWETMLKAPLPRISGWGPTVMFSLLKAGARIAPHTGMFNTRLICHLPLIVPPNCRFRVGNEVREWEEGKLLIFDDTIEHEAWNDSGEDRVVLIFDIWRPELTERERAELTALFSD
ncbi:MAG TPA: aspartyl/asparaginyl beta-hydroxylase domain-containing protein [Sphingomicrobium sp.]